MSTVAQIQILLIIHVLGAIAATGANITYFVWMRRALNNPESSSYTLETIHMMERRYVNPSYVVVGITGIGLVERSGIGFGTPWVILSIVLFLVMTAIGGAVYARILRRQIELAQAGEGASQEYQDLTQRGNVIGLVLTAIVVFLIYLMIFKPSLWD